MLNLSKNEVHNYYKLIEKEENKIIEKEENKMIIRGYAAIISLVIAFAVMFSILILLSSCSTNKYGCGHGNPKMTWNKMVRQINRP